MNIEPDKTWTVAEAKARLSEILRLASTEGPQRIGTKACYIIVPEEEWLKRKEPQIPLGRWLVENMPRIDDLELPDRHEPDRPSPFEGWTAKDFGEDNLSALPSAGLLERELEALPPAGLLERK